MQVNINAEIDILKARRIRRERGNSKNNTEEKT